MYHNDTDNASASKKAMEYLQASMYKDKMPNAGLYWEQLVQRSQELKALNTPKLGDSLLKPDGTAWMSELEHMAPKIDWDDLNQTAALPLGSWLKVDPWDDSVHMLDAKRYAPMNSRDKMPFEVTPIFYKLQRYETAHAAPPAPPAASPAGNSAAADPAPQQSAAQQQQQSAGGPPAAQQPAPQPPADTTAAQQSAPATASTPTPQ
jgi:hypothetical protein